MSADHSFNDDDDFEVIEGAVESIYPPLEASLNSSLVMPPMLVSTTTLVGQEDTVKDDHQTIDLEKMMGDASLASSGSSTDRDLQNILRMQTETIDEMEKALNALPGLHAKVGELTTRNEELEDELQQTRAAMGGVNEAAIRQMEDERRDADERLSAVTAELEKLKQEKKQGDDSAQATIQELKQKMETLNLFKASFEKDNAEKLRKKDDTISSLLQKVAWMEQEKAERERSHQEQLLQRTASLGEVEKLRGDNAALQRKIAELNQHVSEYMVENQRAIEGVMAKTDECERQMHKIRALESDLSKHIADTADNEAIIATLKEVNEEGSKMLEENNRKMEGMKRTLERYGHFSD